MRYRRRNSSRMGWVYSKAVAGSYQTVNKPSPYSPKKEPTNM